jgi:hypothetical protein
MAEWFAQHGTHVESGDDVSAVAARLASETSEPVAICGRAGDLVLAHYLLLHCVGPHTGPGIRYMTFYRLYTEGRDALGDSVYTDPWAEWDAMGRSSV